MFTKEIFVTGCVTAVCVWGLSQVLEADDNAIENLEGLYHLPKLEEVSLKNNRILLLNRP